MFDFNSAILDVAIGVVLVYLLLGLICSLGAELIATYLMKLRSSTLKKGLQTLLDGNGGGNSNAEALLKHPLIQSLGTNPSYIPARRFAAALLDGGIFDKAGDNTYLGNQLAALRKVAGDDVEKLRDSVERWFDDSMDRVSGLYKRKSQQVVLAMSLIIVCVLNADTLTLINALQTDPKLREQVVQAAVDQANQEEGLTQDLPEARDQVAQLGLPLRGWIGPKSDLSDPREFPDSPRGLLYKVVGLALTTAGVSLGAPFWFDALKRLVALSGARPKPKPDAGAPAASGGGT